MSVHPRRVAFVATLSGAAVVAAIATAVSTGSETAQRTQFVGPSVSRQDSVRSAAAIGALRTAAGPDDVVDTDQRRLLADGAGDVSAARRAGDRSRHEQWVMPGAKGSVCQVVSGFASCPPVDYLEGVGVAPMLGYRDETYTVSGIAVDGVSSVELTAGTGVAAEIPVVGNAFAIELRARPVSLRWTGPSGVERFDFPDLAAQNERLRRIAMEARGIPQQP